MTAPLYSKTWPFAYYVLDVLVEPTYSNAVAEAVAPTVVLGSVSVSPTAAETVATAVAPTVVLGSISITPAVAEADAVAVAPSILEGAIEPASANSEATAVAPTIVLGSMTVAPDAAIAVAEAVAPTSSVAIITEAATAVAESIAPDVTITGTGILPATHWFLDTSNNGWFKQSFTKITHDPIAVCEYDGDSPDDRIVLIGSDDGYIRCFDSASAIDDTDNMTAFVTLGPLTGKDGAVPLVLREVQGITDENSHSVLYEILAGSEPETALDDEDYWFDGDGEFAAGLSKVYNPRRSGYYIYTKVGHTTANTPWSIEGVRTRCSAIASSRGRHE